LGSFQKGLLQHIGGIESALQAVVQAQRHHAPQPAALAVQQFGPARLVALGGALHQFPHLGSIFTDKHDP